MDFIVDLPITKYHHDDIMVIVDRLTKVANFIIGNTSYDVITVDKNFMKEIFRVYGFLESIICDKDSKFTSNFWIIIHKEVESKFHFSFAHHPELDGKIKGVNQVLEDMLQIYYMNHTSRWEESLHLVEFAYNNSYHTSLKISSFEELYVKRCRIPILQDNLYDKINIGPYILSIMEAQLKIIQKNLREAIDRQKSLTDMKKTPREFKVGDKVFLRVKLGKSFIKYSKVVARFVGPFEILQQANLVAY